MMFLRFNSKICLTFYVILSLLISMGFTLTAGAGQTEPQEALETSGKWWEVIVEDEVPSPYYDSILYSEIAPLLHEIKKNSNRIKVEVMGQSAGGRNLFMVIVAAPGEHGRFGHYKALRRLMIRDPERALALIDRFDDFKVPVFINGSIHGDEYPGTDAAIRLIQTLAYDNSDEVRQILDHVILLVNVVQNPDGRVAGTRRNSNGFDVNRDFITQSQPETRATVKEIAKWNPMVFLDLHGFVEPMLIEPCTPPHNPNYEYDLYLYWAFYMALAMETEVLNQTGFTSIIPYRDFDLGWDDWPPIYAAMYPMLHGAYGHTLETPSRDERGVDAHYAAVWGALKYVVENKLEMIRDQIEIFRRGFFDLPQVLIPDELLAETPYDQFNDLTIKEFPAAYIIPTSMPFQQSPHQTSNLVDFLLFNGVQVHKSIRNFGFNGNQYPRGTYVVWMDQPKRGLANTILEDGLNVSDIEGLTFYSPPAAWSHPLLWGVERAIMEEKHDIRTLPIRKAKRIKGSLENSKGQAHAFSLTSIEAFQATNDLLFRGKTLFRSENSFVDSERQYHAGTVIFPKNRILARFLSRKFKLNIYTLKEIPEQVVAMTGQKAAVYTNEGVPHCLRELGFDYTVVSSEELNQGFDLSPFQVFINGERYWSYDLNDTGIATIKSFVENGGDYIGIGIGGVSFADQNQLISLSYESQPGNGIINMDYISSDPISAGFREDGHAFVNQPVWFTSVDNGIDVSATIDPANFLVSGFWPGWDTSNAGGMPVIIHRDQDPQDITLIGIDPAFRGHTRNTFRIIGNAIYSGLD